jgi:isocitrate dehydrogenase
LEQGLENVLPQRTIAAVTAHKIALKGPVTTPVGKGFKSVNVQLAAEAESLRGRAAGAKSSRDQDPL